MQRFVQIRQITIAAAIVLIPMVSGSSGRAQMPSDLHYPDHRMLVRTVVRGLDLWSANVEELGLRTGVVESLYLFRAAMNEAPERGYWQIHPETAADILFRYLDRPSKAELRRRMELLLGYPIDELRDDPEWLQHELHYNDVLGAALARLWYLMSPYQIPSADDLEAQGELWKAWFNTHQGSGTVDYFVSIVNQRGV